MTVHRWSHAVARALRAEVDRIVAAEGLIVVTPTADRAAGQANEVFRKFMRFIGFNFEAAVVRDGVWRVIYARRR